MLREQERGREVPMGEVRDITSWAKENLTLPDTRGELVYLKEWSDELSETRGWLARWGSPRLEVSGGGIRMRPGATAGEAIFLASTMFEKFGIAGPEINGSKFVIDYDPRSPDKMAVLERFLAAFLPELETVGTAGDLGVSEEESAEVLTKYGIPNPQYGVLRGLGITERVDRLNQIVHLPLQKPFSPKHRVLVDVTAGWSTFVATETFLEQKYGMSVRGKKVTLHGVGAVGGSAGYFLERAGAEIVAFADREGSVAIRGQSFSELLKEIDVSSGCLPRKPGAKVLGDPTEVFSYPSNLLVLAATSEAVTEINADTVYPPLLVEGANRPMTQEAEEWLYWREDDILPDFLVNAGTAELFTIGMLGEGEVTEEETLGTIRKITESAISEAIEISKNTGVFYREAASQVSRMNLWKTFI